MNPLPQGIGVYASDDASQTVALHSGRPNQVFQNFAARVISTAFRLPSRDQYTARTAFTIREVQIRGRER